MAKVKSNSVITVAMEGRSMRFTVLGAGEAVLDLEALHAAVIQKATLHGLKARIVDAAAIPCDPTTGKSASAAQKYTAVLNLVSHYNSGSTEWSPKRSERIGSDEGLLATALGELRSDRTQEQIKEFISGLTKPQRLALMATKDIRQVVDRIRAEATQGVDAEELLSGL